MSALLQDLRSAFRLIVKNPTFSVIVIATLALGIGLNTAVFSALDGLLLRPLPGVRNADELVQVYRTWPGMLYGSNSVPHFLDVRDRSRDVFSDAAIWGFVPMNLSVNGHPRRIMGQLVSADYFKVFGVNPTLGRTFVPAEDSGRGAHPVVVLSHRGWVELFGADPGVIGKTLVLDGQTYSVIGVTPEAFMGGMAILTPLVWAPVTQSDQLEPGSNRWESRGNNSFNMVARFKPGVTVERAQSRIQAILGELRELYPDDYRHSGIGLVLQSEAGIHPMFRSAQLSLSAVIMGVVLLLLLIACVNVANLMLARARDRSREMAVRLSIGARRSVLIRQLLTESLVLSLLAGLAGLAVAWWAMNIVNRAVAGLALQVQITPDLHISPTVLGFTLGVSLLTGVLFGLAPALQATRPDLVPALKGEAPAGGSKSRMSRGLVIAQMALSIVLLISAGLFLRNLQTATQIDKGFISDNLLLADVDPGLQGYSRARTEDFYRQLTERLEASPSVKSVSYTNTQQLSLGGSDWGVTIPGYTPAPDENMSIYVATVTPGYFETMGIPMLKGRGFTPQDDSAAARVIVINQRFADRFWPGQDPIGRTVRVGGSEHTVVGMTSTGRYRSLGENPTAYMWLAQAQHWETGMDVVIRTVGDPQAVVPLLRREVAALDPDLPLASVNSMNDRLGITFLPARLAATVLGVFGILGLVLASLGVYGVMSHAVVQRTREIGIRLAIGAGAPAVVRTVMGDGMALVGIGIAVGLGGALGAARLMSGVLYGTGLDPATFAVVPLVLGGVAALAIWIPARRAASVNPVVVLRQD
jgi:putative ABC transport system permease protein